MKKLQRGEISPSFSLLSWPATGLLSPADLSLPRPLPIAWPCPSPTKTSRSSKHLTFALITAEESRRRSRPVTMPSSLADSGLPLLNPKLWILDSTILSMRLLTPSELSVHCRASVTNKYSPALHSSLKHQLKYLCCRIVFTGPKCLWVPVSPSTYIQELWLKLWLVSQKEGPLLSLFSWLWSLQELGTAHLPKVVNSLTELDQLNVKKERIVSQINCFIFQHGVLIKGIPAECIAMPTWIFIWCPRTTISWILYCCMVFNYSSQGL